MARDSSNLALKTDEELRILQKNAKIILDREPTTELGQRAGTTLAAVEEEFARRHLPGAIARFKEDFQKFFDDPAYLDQERNYKVDAAQFCRDQLHVGAFQRATDSTSREALLKDVRRLIGMTNLLQPTFEKPRLLDKISEPAVTPTFLTILEELMWGLHSPEIRLARFCEVTADWGLNKWTNATYFLFFAHPGECMFVKPESMRRALDSSPYVLTYQSTPTAELYGGILGFSRWLRSKLEEFKPKDMIDIQSFIWDMAPTGKWAK